MISLRGISKSYRGQVVLKSLDLTITTGISAVLGPNGAGKSTLLKMVCGLESADSGTVALNGLDITSNAIDTKRIIGVLPEQLGLFDSLTVLENLQCVAPIYGVSREETDTRAESLITLLDLEHGRNTLARDCSYGMRKKTALALALIHKPKILMLDEPFEGIDPSSSQVIQQLLQRLAEKGVTILITSHLLSVVESIAERVIILREGAVAWDSASDQRARPLEQLYFELIGPSQLGAIPWLE